MSPTAYQPRQPRPLPVRVGAAVLGLGLGLGSGLGRSGCGGSAAPQSSPAGPVSSSIAVAPQTTSPSPSSVTPSSAGSIAAPASGSPQTSASPAASSSLADGTLQASFTELAAGLSGPAQLALVPVGGGDAVVLGEELLQDSRPVAAWSTIKVPLAIAALQAGSQASPSPTPGEATPELVRLAIVASDNQAADELWARLGSGTQAARATQQVLRAGGDRVTVVQSSQVAPPHSPYGQTRWSAADAAGFTAALPCRPEAAPVYRLMGQLDAAQRWGLAKSPGQHAKGGWGPQGSGYLVRQIGVMPGTDGQQVAVALAVASPQGFERGTQDLDRMAGWLEQHRAELPAGSC